MGARETALRVLMSCRNNHAWADAALKAQLGRDGLVGPAIGRELACLSQYRICSQCHILLKYFAVYNRKTD